MAQEGNVYCYREGPTGTSSFYVRSPPAVGERHTNSSRVYTYRGKTTGKKRRPIYVFEYEGPVKPPPPPVVVPPFEGTVTSRPVEDLVLQRERAQDMRVEQLYDQMRTEAARQVREILGVDTDPDMWHFWQSNRDATEMFRVDIGIDGLQVHMTDRGRLWVHAGAFVASEQQRLRTKADFEEMLRKTAYSEDYNRRHPPDEHPG